jgi:ribosome-binding factor A
MASESRAIRVGGSVKKEIAALLSRGVKDPRIGFVSVMGVRMSPDLRYANVYVSLYGSESEKKSSLIGLKHSSGWIRRELGKNLRLRLTPELRFFKDTSLDDVYHLENLFTEINKTESSGGEGISAADDQVESPDETR